MLEENEVEAYDLGQASKSNLPLAKQANEREDEMTIDRTQKDVLCGRGVQVLHHVGNLRLHLAANEFRDEYLRSRRDRKKAIIQTIVMRLKTSGSRFLRYSKNDKTKWVEANDTFAYHKVSHVLRGQNTGKAVRKMKAEGSVPALGSSVSEGIQHQPKAQNSLPQASAVPILPQSNGSVASADSNLSYLRRMNPNSSMQGLQMQTNLLAGQNASTYAPLPPPQAANVNMLVQQAHLLGNPLLGINLAHLQASKNPGSTMISQNLPHQYLAQHRDQQHLNQRNSATTTLPQHHGNYSISNSQSNALMTTVAQQLVSNNSAHLLAALLNNLAEERASNRTEPHSDGGEKQEAKHRQSNTNSARTSEDHSQRW